MDRSSALPPFARSWGAPGPATSPRPPRVLLAEEARGLRARLSTVLRAAGLDVHAVGSGTQLLAALGSVLVYPDGVPFDVLVSEARMPGPDGIRVVAGLREAGWQLPVVMLSNPEDAEAHVRAGLLGAVATFDKPLDVSRLAAYVTRLVRRP